MFFYNETSRLVIRIVLQVTRFSSFIMKQAPEGSVRPTQSFEVGRLFKYYPGRFIKHIFCCG